MPTYIIESASFHKDLILSDPPYNYPRKLDRYKYSESKASGNIQLINISDNVAAIHSYQVVNATEIDKKSTVSKCIMTQTVKKERRV